MGRVENSAEEPIGVLTFLLNWLADNQREYTSASRRRTPEQGQRLQGLQAKAGAHTRGHFDQDVVLMDPPEAQRLGAQLHGLVEHVFDLDMPLVVRAMALGIDSFVGPSIVERLATVEEHRASADGKTWDGARPLVRGDLVPIANPERGGRKGQFWPVVQRPYRTHHVTVARDLPIPVTLDFSLAGLKLSERLSVALIDPSKRDDFPSIRDAKKGVALPAPRDASVVLDRARSALDTAAQRGTDVVVLPEYVMPPSSQAELVEYWTARSTGPVLLVPGTGTDAQEADGTNVTHLMARLPDGPVVQSVPIQKATPLEELDGTGFVRPVEVLKDEGIALRLFATNDGMKVCVLICRDAIADPVPRLLDDFEVELLLIPAQSPDLQPFEALAHAQAVLVGTATYVVNSAFLGGGAGAIGHPKLARSPDADSRGSPKVSPSAVAGIKRVTENQLTLVAPDEHGAVLVEAVAVP